MKLCSIVLFSLVHLVSSDASQKCCPPGQIIVDKNSTLLCDTNPSKRIQSNFGINNFLSGTSEGECIDIFAKNQTAIFGKDQQGKITKRRDLDTDFFPKCCPLNHLYNQQLHSCQVSAAANSSGMTISQNSFVFVGLPSCEIISDVLIPSLEEIEWSNSQVRFKVDERFFTRGKFCIDSAVSESMFVVRICEGFEVCNRIRCIRKCCPDGQSFINGSECTDTFRYGADLHSARHFEKPSAPFAIIHGIQKPVHFLKKKNVFTINESGTFSIYSNKSESYIHHLPTQQSYCLEHAFKEGRVNGYTFFAKTENQLHIKFYTRWIKIISCVFLFLTMLVYLMLPAMLNLFGKILLGYSFATFLYFFFLCLSQFLYEQYSDIVCKIVGFLIILSSFWSYTWLNIMCIDIWASFGSPRTFSGPLQRNELKKLIQYSFYGWCLPLVWTLVIVLLDATPILPEAVHPYVGFKKCYMEKPSDRSGNYAFHLFITLPVSLQLISNIVLFAKTIVHCLKIRRNIKKMNESSKKNYRVGKDELHLVLKLAVIMGVCFLFETISTLYDFSKNPVTSTIEVVGDTINCLQGVFIFVVFICKRKILNNLLERLGIRRRCGYNVSSSMATDSLHTNSTKKETINLR